MTEDSTWTHSFVVKPSSLGRWWFLCGLWRSQFFSFLWRSPPHLLVGFLVRGLAQEVAEPLHTGGHHTQSLGAQPESNWIIFVVVWLKIQLFEPGRAMFSGTAVPTLRLAAPSTATAGPRFRFLSSRSIFFKCLFDSILQMSHWFNLANVSCRTISASSFLVSAGGMVGGQLSRLQRREQRNPFATGHCTIVWFENSHWQGLPNSGVPLIANNLCCW